METFQVYFELCSDDIDLCDGLDENRMMQETWVLLKDHCSGKKLYNDGHNESGLVCYFMADINDLPGLEERIYALSGAGDDGVFLWSGGYATNFSIVEKPGISKPIPFIDWNDIIESWDGHTRPY